MLTTRWRSFGNDGWNEFHYEMNDLLDQLHTDRRRTLAPPYPTLNVWEQNDTVHVETELPGMKLDDLEIYVTKGDRLAIKGDRKRPSPETSTWHRQERRFGNFSRVVTLPADVDHNKMEASFNYGVLTITAPKKDNAQLRRITVKSD
jgi:HSP20 family protein